METIGERIKWARERLGLTQEQLANKINVKIPTISGYETNYRQPDNQKLIMLAAALNVTTDFLLGRTTIPDISAFAKFEAISSKANKIISIARKSGKSVDYQTALKIAEAECELTPEQKVFTALSGEPLLLEFWKELATRDDLLLMFKQTKDLPPEAIKRIIKYIKMVEEEEAKE